MNDRKKGSVIKTILWSVLASVMGYVINFFLTPFISDNLGVEAYGYVTLTKTFVDYGALITTALNSYAVRYIGIEYHKNDFKRANEYYNSVLFADVFLGVCIVVFSVLFSLTIKSTLKVPDYLEADVKKLFILCFINFSINTIMSVFSSAAYLKNRLDLNYLFRTLGYLTEIVALAVLYLCCRARLYYVGISLILDSCIILISRIWMVKRYTPELIVCSKMFNITSVKNLVLNGVWNSVNSLGNILNTGLDMLITNIMLSSTDLGLLGIVKTFPNMFVLLYQLVSQPFQPLLLKSYSLGEKQKLKDTLKISMKTSGYITFLIYTGFVAIGDSFYALWLPGQNAHLLYLLTLLALLPNAMEGILYPCYYIYTLCVKNKIPCFITIIGGLLNVASMYCLIKYTALGIYAVLLTTAVVMAVITYITNPIYMSICIKVEFRFFYKIILRGVVSCAIMCLFIKKIAGLFIINSWVSLIAVGILIFCCGSVLYFELMLDAGEKNMVLRKIYGIVKKEEV